MPDVQSFIDVSCTPTATGVAEINLPDSPAALEPKRRGGSGEVGSRVRFSARAGGHVRGEPVLLVQSRGGREGGAAVRSGGVARRENVGGGTRPLRAGAACHYTQVRVSGHSR